MLKRRTAVSVLLCCTTIAVALELGVSSRAIADESVTACGPLPNKIFSGSSAGGMTVDATCPGSVAGGGGFYIGALAGYPQGTGAIWQTEAPPGLTIVGASIPPGQLYASGVNAGKGSGFRIQSRFGRRGRTVPAGYSNTLLRFARRSFLLPSHRPPTSRPGPRVWRETPTRSQLSTKYTLIWAASGHISKRPDTLQ